MMTDCSAGRLTFTRFDERFLGKSWEWLNDTEIKRLTMTPDFTQEAQARWFAGLPAKKDYLIWGLLCESTPIGVAGLKRITERDAEYWGYIGERDYWGAGLGKEIMRFVLARARELGLSELYLKVGVDNQRALALYTKTGFRLVSENDGVLHLRIYLNNTDVR